MRYKKHCIDIDCFLHRDTSFWHFIARLSLNLTLNKLILTYLIVWWIAGTVGGIIIIWIGCHINSNISIKYAQIYNKYACVFWTEYKCSEPVRLRLTENMNAYESYWHRKSDVTLNKSCFFFTHMENGTTVGSWM